MSRTGVVVVSYGSHLLLERNLARTVAATDVIVVVVDSYTDDQERAAVAALCAERGWDLVGPPTNVGFGGGMNLGVARAIELGAQSVVLLNPDLALAPEGLAALDACVRAAPDALVAPRIDRPDGSPWAVGTTDLVLADGTMRSSARRPADADAAGYDGWLSGACLALSADLWTRSGGFDEAYFLYWEDVDFSRRVRRAGGHLLVDPDVVAIHDEGSTHGPGTSVRAKSETYYYFTIRNRFLFAATWLSAPYRRRWVRTTPRAVRSVLLQGGRLQLVTSVAPWRATVRALRDGRRLLRSRPPAPKL